MAQRSIVIGGGAFAGLALALALRQAWEAKSRSSSPIRRWQRGRAAIPRHRHRRGLPPAVRGDRVWTGSQIRRSR